MRLFPRPQSILPVILGKLAASVFAIWLVLGPLSAPANAENPISEFLSALKDGQNAGRIEAAQFGLRQGARTKNVSPQYLNAAEQVAQRIVNELSAKHPGSQTFAWMASHARDSILADPPGHASDLQAAATLIYEEAAREVANPPKAGATDAPATPATARPEQPQVPRELPPLQAQTKKAPSSQALPILLVLAAGVAGLVWFMRRRRKAVNVSYVQVKSPVPAADASQTDQTPIPDRGTNGR